MATLFHVGPVIPTGGGGGGGTTFVRVVAGENISAGAPVALGDSVPSGSPVAYEGDANGGGTRQEVIGIAPNAILQGATGNIQVVGQLKIPDAIWDAVPAVTDVGKPVYVSNNVGQLTITAPANAIQIGFVAVGGAGVTEIVVGSGGMFVPSATASAPNLIQSGEAEVYNSTTPLVLAGFYLDPTAAGYVAGDTQIVFRVVAANGAAGFTNYVELYNMTTPGLVYRFTINSTVISKQEYIFAIPADLPLADTHYEVRTYLGAAPTLPAETVNVYSWAIELQAI